MNKIIISQSWGELGYAKTADIHEQMLEVGDSKK
jgi:hypothetical protein